MSLMMRKSNLSQWNRTGIHSWGVFFLLWLAVLMSAPVLAQTTDKPFMAEMSAKFLDYNGPVFGDYTLYKQFDPGISIAAHAFLNRAMNLSLTSSFVPETSYPMTEQSFISTSLIDVNALLTFKSNGTFLREDALIAPYLGVGGGLNTASNNIRFYVPAALGVRMQMTKNFSLQFQAMYKQPIKTGDIQPVSYSAGFVFSLPTEERIPQIEDEEDDDFPPPIAELPDRDKDGVLDRDDLCPEEKGKAMYLGCPEENAPTNAVVDNGGARPPRPSSPLPKPQPTYSPPKPSTPPSTSVETYGPVGDLKEIQPVSQGDLAILEDAMKNVYFKPSSDELTYPSYAKLDAVARLLRKYPDYNLEVFGHTDDRGNTEDNIVLSIKRAFKVKYYLVYQQGISIARISSDGLSSGRPAYSNSTEEGRAKNRRVEFNLVPRDGSTAVRGDK